MQEQGSKKDGGQFGRRCTRKEGEMEGFCVLKVVFLKYEDL